MTNYLEQLQKVYAPKDTPQESCGWIPKRLHRKGDLQAELREIAPESSELSSVRVEEILSTEMILSQAKDDIFEQVAVYLLERYGQKDLETRLLNFNESWNSLYAKYGNDLILALGTLTDECEIPFVNFRGYLNKKVTKEAVKKLKADRRNQ